MKTDKGSSKGWIVFGLSWGIVMGISMGIIYPLIEDTFSFKFALTSIPLWLIGGLGFGFITKKWIFKQNKNFL